MTEVFKSGVDTNGIVLLIGVLVLALLVLLRNRPFIWLGSLFRGIGKLLSRIFLGPGRAPRRVFRPIIWLLKAFRIIPRTVSKEGRNYVGPSAFSALVRAFRPKTDIELELEKTDFMTAIAEAARRRAVPKGTSVPLEDAAQEFHDEYCRLRDLFEVAFKKADGDPAATRENFDRLQKEQPEYDEMVPPEYFGENPPEGAVRTDSQGQKCKIYLDPDTVGPPLQREKDQLSKHGLIFKWLEPESDYIKKEDIGWDGAVPNYFLSNIFFTYDIPVGTPRSGIRATDLYEDIDGAFNVRMFGIRDSDIYYLFTQMRKAINGNVRRLTVWFSLIAAVFFLLNVYLAGPVPEPISELLQLNGPGTLLGMELPGKTRFLLLSFIIGAAAMWLLYTAEYRHYVRNNGREMNNFLTRYMARLNNMYRQAERNARGVFAGEIDTSAADAEEHAQVWFANIQWIAFRAFYVETFLRNTLYQIYRNSGYYVFLVPMLFIVGIFFLLLYTDHLSTLGGMFVWNGWPPDEATWQTILFTAALVILVAMVAFYLAHSLRDLESTIRESEWFNFHHFELQRTTTNLIGRYGNEIRFWRERFKQSEGRSA